MKCELIRIERQGKVYFKVSVPFGNKGETFDFAIKPMFLSKNAFIALLRLTDKEEKSE